MNNKRKGKKAVFGQNFLINKEIAADIINSCRLSAGDSIVEIGSGEGILTDLIIGNVMSFTIIEIDPFYYNFIIGKLGLNNFDNNTTGDKTEIINVDALKFDYIGLSNRLSSKLRVISNLPYEISSPIIDRFIKEKEAFLDLTLMFQKEFAKRLYAKENDSARGSLSVIADINFKIEKLFDVEKDNFNPVPEVDSTVLRLVPRNEKDLDEDFKWASSSQFFSYFVHQIFKLRRKKLKNSIYASFLGIPPDIKESIFIKGAGVDLNKRPQELTTKELIIAGRKYDEYLTSAEKQIN